jgi:LuxR family transcriptional regulator, maltose regulon positive regulatory protein
MRLLTTKLHRPSIPFKRVLRSRLIQRLNAGLSSGRQITLISAPAGYGKSTCAADWLGSLSLPVAWLSLDPLDDDPARFFTYLVAALQHVHETLGQEIGASLQLGQVPSAEVISTTLLNGMLDFDQPFVLVLDDVQVLQDPCIHETLSQLLANQPDNLHLVMLTREDPSLPLARLRANNQITELRAADLRFTASEVEHFLREVMGLSLSPTDIARLEEKTEGWIAGLQLVGLSMQDHANPSAFISTLSGSQRHILGYLTEEVLRRQPDDIQQFLLETSILERLNGDLCNAATGRTDSHRVLERLLAANLFLIPLDDEQHWYRYHHLFADLLRNFQHSQQGPRAEQLHQRASLWYASAGMANEAVQHALAASDFQLVVALIEQHAVELLMQGHAKTLEGCLQALPSEWAMHNPRANLAFAWMHLMRGSFAQVIPSIHRLQAIFANATIQDASLQAQWLALQAFSLIGQGNTIESLCLAREALRIALPEDGYVLGLVYHALATAYVVTGDYARAVETYQKAVVASRTAGNFAAEVMCIAALVQMALQHGQLNFAFELASQGIERVEQEGMLSPITAALYGSVGQVYYLRRHLELARPYYLRAMQLSPLSAYSDTEIGYQVVQSRLLQTQGDLKASAAAIQRAVDLMRIAPPVWVREEVAAQQVRVYLAQHRLADAEMVLQAQGFQAEGTFAVPDLNPDRSVTPSVGLLYNSALRIEMYRAQVTHNLAGLQNHLTVAGDLTIRSLEEDYLPTALETLLIRAQMHAILGSHAASLADAIRALELAEPEGFVSLFVEEGHAIADLLTELLKSRVHPAYIQHILNAFSGGNQGTLSGEASDAGSTDDWLDPLSHRELEILRLIADGRSNQVIADQLVLSLHTVKKHISNIFGKLGVNSRTQAVALARESGML